VDLDDLHRFIELKREAANSDTRRELEHEKTGDHEKLDCRSSSFWRARKPQAVVRIHHQDCIHDVFVVFSE
jgi:hypothetical protein